MKKLLFIANVSKSLDDGIFKKVSEQSKALSSHYDVSHLFLPLLSDFKSPLIWLFTYLLSSFRLILRKQYDAIYIRNLNGIYSIFFFPFLILSRSNRIYLEIPTYPFEPHVSVTYIIDSFLKRLLFRFLITKVFIVGSNLQKIWGVSAQLMNNCIDIDSRPIIQPVANITTSFTVRLISVSSMAPWHGTLRLIRSLSFFKYLPIDIVFVGYGPYYQKSLEYSTQLGLEKRITFTGSLHGKKLDDVLNTAHVGVDSLGRHSTFQAVNQSLKAREYCSRGLPFIKSHSDPIFDDQDFVFNLKPDDSIIDLSKVLSWYNQLKPINHSKIRQFALDNFSWVKEYSRLHLFDF